MIDRAALIKLTLIAAVVCAAGAAVSFGAWGGAVAGGVGVGALLGMVPFLSWSYAAGALEASPRRRALGVMLLVGKLGLYAAALYLTVAKALVHPAGVMAGLGVVAFIFITGSMMLPRPKEARP